MTEDDIQGVPLHLLQMERYLWSILSMDMTAAIDIEGAFLDTNPIWKKTVGYDADELLGTYLLDYLELEQREKVLSQMQRLVTADFETTTLDFRFLTKDGAFLHLLANVAFVPEHECFYLVARSLQEGDQDSMVSAYHDVLTGLPNRYFLQRRMDDALNKLDADGRALAVLFVDLDRFKPVNDTFGHRIGDLILQEVAQRLEDCVQPDGFAARLGGDEFVVIVQSEDLNTRIGTVATHIMQVLEKPFQVQGEEVTISASIGISLHPEGGRNPEELLDTADAAMYAVKRSGKSGFRVASGQENSIGDPS